MAIEEPDFAAEVGQQMSGGRSRRRGGKSPLKADTAAVRELDNAFKSMHQRVKDLRKEVKGLASDANAAANAMGGVTAPGGGSGATMAGGTPRPVTTGVNSSQPPATQAGMSGGGGGGGGGGTGPRPGLIGPFGAMRGYLVNAQQNMGGPRVTGALIGGYIVGQAAGQVMGGIDARIDRGAQYALSADRIGVAMQQRYGMSQMSYMQNVRQPLANYRLGAGGANQLLQFQMQTGINAQRMASGVEGLRALSGWGQGTGDILQQQASMLDPQVANRMFMMLGTGPIGLGGTVTDPIRMRQQMMRTLGLDRMSREKLERALRPGSIQRARMADAGVSNEMQEQLIGYAQSQLTYREKGGQGIYDPSKKSHRELVGVEDNFATQVEETERRRGQREEQFMERQVDNMARMEKWTQEMVGLLGNIEDTLQAAVGIRTSGRAWQRALGTALMIGGAGATVLSGGSLAPLGVGAMAVGGALSASGDPTETPGGTGVVSGGSGTTPKTSDQADGNIQVPFGYGGGKVSLNELKTKSTFAGMNGRMQQRLLAMMRASGGKVGIGTGLRDSKVQEAMFRDRYRPDPNGDVTWNGQKWKRVKGAPAAPPGRSMHEIGLAADLVGDLDWVQANAGRFGLKTFAGVNNEPWHVQPSELPNSRREYEKDGAQWGTDDGFDPNADFSEGSQPVNTEHPTGRGGGSGGVGAGVMQFSSDMSISDIMNAMEQANMGRLGGAVGGTSSTTGAAGGPTGESVAATGATFTAGGASGAKLAAQAAYAAGFRGEDLWKIVSIAGRESGFDPTAINKDSRDTGMWQIAPVNWGQYSQQDLLDPFKNAKVAWSLYQSSGFHGWKAASSRKKNSKGQWVVDESGQGGAGWAMNGNELWHTEAHQPVAREAIDSLNLSGDGAFDHGGGRGKSAPVQARMAAVLAPPAPEIHIEIKPNIEFVGTPASTDLQALAMQVTAMIEQGVREANMRTS